MKLLKSIPFVATAFIVISLALFYYIFTLLADAEKIGAGLASLTFFLATISFISFYCLKPFIKKLNYRYLIFSILLLTLPAWILFEVSQDNRIGQPAINQLVGKMENFARDLKSGNLQSNNVPVIASISYKDNPDKITDYFLNFSKRLQFKLQKMNDEIEASGMYDVFDNNILLSSDAIGSAVKMGMKQKQILNQYRKELSDYANGVEEYLSSIIPNSENDFSNQEKWNIGLIKGFTRGLAQDKKMIEQLFDLRWSEVNAEIEFLNFLNNTRDQYVIERGKLLAKSDDWIRKYNYLSKNVENARIAVELFRQEASRKSDAELEKLKKERK